MPAFTGGKTVPRSLFKPLSLLAACWLSCLWGCSTFSHSFAPSTPVAPKNAWDGEQALRLSYRIDAGEMGAPLAVSCVQAQQVAYQEVEASPISERSVGVLDIQYPHPADRPGKALVGVVIQRQETPQRGLPPSWIQQVRGWFHWPDENTILGSERDLHEAWVMDVSKSELEQVIAELRTAGFYESGERRLSHVRVTSRIGMKYVSKEWTPVSALDGLMHRVRSEGQLVSYQGIAVPLENRPSAPKSLIAWKALQQQNSPAAEQNPRTQIAQASEPVFGAPGAALDSGWEPGGSKAPAAEVARLPQSGSSGSWR